MTIGWLVINDPIPAGATLLSTTYALRFTVGPNAEELMTLTNSQVDPSVTIHSTLKVNGGVYTNVVDTTNLKVQDSLTTPRAIIGTTPRTGLRLDADQWVELPAMNNQIPFNTGVTIQAWVYMFTASQPARILECLGVNNENSIIFGFEDGLLAAGVVNGLEPDVKAAFLFPTLAWTHVAVVIATTGAVKFYVNGTWVPTQPVNMNMNVKTAPPQARARKPNTVGKTSSNPGTAFSGLIRELSVWTGEAPIHSAVDPVIKPDATGLVGHWRMATGNMSNTCTNQPLLGSATLKSKDGQPLAGWAPGHDRTQGAGTSIMQDGWIPLTIPNASKWSAVTGLMNPPVSYYKDSLGIVHFRGFLLAMSPTQEEVLVQLPPGYRPEFTSLQVVHHNKNGCVGVFVGADGKITIPASTSAAFISLDSICFRAYP
jgi:hypothetical protein